MDVRMAVRDFIAKELLSNSSEDVTQDDVDLVESALFDSLGLLRLVSFIEKSMNIQVPDEDVTMENFRNIHAITRYIERRLAKTCG